MQNHLRAFIKSNIFNNTIIFIVFLDLILMGLEAFYSNETLARIESLITYIYIGELALRWFGRESNSAFRKDRRNLFDLAIISLRVIPETGPLALLKLYRSTLVLNLYPKVYTTVHTVINNFYLQSLKRLSY